MVIAVNQNAKHNHANAAKAAGSNLIDPAPPVNAEKPKMPANMVVMVTHAKCCFKTALLVHKIMIVSLTIVLTVYAAIARVVIRVPIKAAVTTFSGTNVINPVMSAHVCIPVLLRAAPTVAPQMVYHVKRKTMDHHVQVVMTARAATA